MDRVIRAVASLGILLGPLGTGLAGADESAETAGPAFEYQERSTVDTIRLPSMAEDSMADTVIEGGLEAPAAGVPVAETGEDFYLDPLALQPNDDRTDLGRSEIPVDIRFSNPRSIPGQTHGNTYRIQPPSNRTYRAYGASVSER
ncbi:MAG: hypothetical protein R3175_12595 [Marinobacter sp.]|uniref:hypothetical protein n=1 Tax=Marinobacter sp. TaxID=50741 RepID=UPI00299E7FC4|nr:hypothetical protein [Marinobacter sp.]MDX1756894.1 hypothetical protein [Marinobacter sp.]